jgi:5-methylcytosine-specific restriction endonuclease McrBC regulatory subunit McrC
VVVDAKYKRHWEELQEGRWHERSDELREQHRADLLQVLAYANLVSNREVVCCLVYPCSLTTWESLARRGRLFHQSELPNRGRRVRVWLTAVPMSAAIERVTTPFHDQLRSLRSQT